MKTNNETETNETETNNPNYTLPPVVDRSVEIAIYASTFTQVFGMTRNSQAALRAAQEAVLAHYEAVTAAEHSRQRRGPGRPRKLKAA